MIAGGDAHPPQPESDLALREQLSSLQGLLVLSMLMNESGEEHHILRLATTAVPSLGRCRLHGIYALDVGWRATEETGLEADVRADIEAQFAVLSSAGGAVAILGETWAWAFPLRSLEGHFGYLVVSANEEPPASEQFLLRILSQQTGIALANARLHARERAMTVELRTANTALAKTISALERSTAIHDRLTQVAVAGEGPEGIAQAVHELIGYPIAVEDRHGNLQAWAGPDRPDPYPKDSPARREQMLRRALRDGHIIREDNRLIAVAGPRADVLGAIVLIDPAASAGEAEHVALEHGATVLAMELGRLQSLAETELRLGADLVGDLLAGTEEGSALARARALGYDLERAHRVIVVDGCGSKPDGDAFFQAVRQSARDYGVGSLLVSSGGLVVVLSDIDPPWEGFRGAVLRDLGGGRCRIGVGGVCDRPVDFPRSYREARLALKIQTAFASSDQATVFDQLGVYRILAEVEDTGAVERFVREWLGSLLDYDKRTRSELVMTLSRYFERGKNYDATAKALAVHRSTLKYRLGRIKEISGHDLSDPDTNFNLQLATRAWHTLLALRD
jgi:sugar diacid utilization regulator